MPSPAESALDACCSEFPCISFLFGLLPCCEVQNQMTGMM